MDEAISKPCIILRFYTYSEGGCSFVTVYSHTYFSKDTLVLYLLVSAICYLKSRKEIKELHNFLLLVFSSIFLFFLIFHSFPPGGKRKMNTDNYLSGGIKMCKIGMTLCSKIG